MLIKEILAHNFMNVNHKFIKLLEIITGHEYPIDWDLETELIYYGSVLKVTLLSPDKTMRIEMKFESGILFSYRKKFKSNVELEKTEFIKLTDSKDIDKLLKSMLLFAAQIENNNRQRLIAEKIKLRILTENHRKLSRFSR